MLALLFYILCCLAFLLAFILLCYLILSAVLLVGMLFGGVWQVILCIFLLLIFGTVFKEIGERFDPFRRNNKP
nr:MAG TPA: hypothetical protein [Caudoviricetes sp.]